MNFLAVTRNLTLFSLIADTENAVICVYDEFRSGLKKLKICQSLILW